jgi:aminoglycoside phosphotransferase (APT) family kinase protein
VDKAAITPEIVRRLLAEQFPHWADLPVTRVEHDGWDNTTFRLGTEMSVRLPSGDAYTAQVAKEHEWLPMLARHLPLPIPRPLARGAPSDHFPRPWSIYQWLEGESATADRVAGLERFATDLADFLRALYDIDAVAGPPAGPHSHFRGGPTSTWDEQTRGVVDALGDEIDAGLVLAAWERASESRFDGRPVWVHGDVVSTNLLVVDGALAAVIDFGCSAVGDPACDVTIAWTLFHGDSRDTFRTALGLDAATWERGRAWALWKALIELYQDINRRDRGGPGWVRMGWRIPPRELIGDLLATT